MLRSFIQLCHNMSIKIKENKETVYLNTPSCLMCRHHFSMALWETENLEMNRMKFHDPFDGSDKNLYTIELIGGASNARPEVILSFVFQSVVIETAFF